MIKFKTGSKNSRLLFEANHWGSFLMSPKKLNVFVSAYILKRNKLFLEKEGKWK